MNSLKKGILTIIGTLYHINGKNARGFLYFFNFFRTVVKMAFRGIVAPSKNACALCRFIPFCIDFAAVKP
jgi:hypothetical protein